MIISYDYGAYFHLYETYFHQNSRPLIPFFSLCTDAIDLNAAAVLG